MRSKYTKRSFNNNVRLKLKEPLGMMGKDMVLSQAKMVSLVSELILILSMASRQKVLGMA
jgi:hypothetical protein